MEVGVLSKADPTHLCICTVGPYASLYVCLSIIGPKFILENKSYLGYSKENDDSCQQMELQKFTPDLMFVKYEADLNCQNITCITTKGRGIRVSHPVLVTLAFVLQFEWGLFTNVCKHTSKETNSMKRANIAEMIKVVVKGMWAGAQRRMVGSVLSLPPCKQNKQNLCGK